jgi:hypothetical protein
VTIGGEKLHVVPIGKTRLLGSSTCEDKLVQDAVHAVLEPIDAQDVQE